jgi:hypothetical protein
LLEDVAVSSLARYPADPVALVQSRAILALAAAPVIWAGTLVALANWARSSAAARVRGWTSRDAQIAALVLLAALNFVPFLSHAYLHYWLQVVPWATLLAATGIHEWLRRKHEPGPSMAYPRRLGRALGTGIVGCAAFITACVPLGFTALVPSLHQQLLDQQRIADIIAADSPPGSSVLIGPAEPEYYFLANRLPPVPDVYLLPINLTDGTLRTLLAAVADRRFDVIVWQPHRDGVLDQPDYLRIEQAIRQHYSIVLNDGGSGVTIYRRGLPEDGASRVAP